MKRIIFLLSSFLLLAAVACAAPPVGQSIGLREVIAALERPFTPDAPPEEKIVDFQADFFQESHISSLERSQRGEGRVFIKFDEGSAGRVPKVLFRWEYDRPTRQEFVSNGEKLWVYLPENRQVILSNIEQTTLARQNNPMTFLTGLSNLSRDFFIRWADPNEDVAGNYILQLEPNRTTTMFHKMLVVVDRNAVLARHNGTPDNSIFPILSTSVYDTYDNLTIIEFSNIRTNRGMFLQSFDFMIPPNVDVVRPTGESMGF